MKTNLSTLTLAAVIAPAILSPVLAAPAFAKADEASAQALPIASDLISPAIVVVAADPAMSAPANAAADSPAGAQQTALNGLVDAELSRVASTLELGSLGASDALNQAADGATGPAGSAQAREESFTLVLGQDSFFGFYPSFNGLIPVSENVDFSFYGIMWTRPSFNLMEPTGAGLWTEFGMGANFYLDEGRLQIKPQIGITNGALLSGGAIVDGDTAGSLALDGIVPNLTVIYKKDKFEFEYYGGYYAAFRGRSEDASLDFLHTWVNFGFKASENLSFGPHYELLANTRNTYPGGSPSNTYSWLGGYIQFALDNGFFARFTTGADLNDTNAGDFYKLGVGFTF